VAQEKQWRYETTPHYLQIRELKRRIKKDAVALAPLIIEGIRDGKEMAQVVETYSKLRQPRGNFVLNASRSQGFRFEFNTAEFEDLRENEAVQESRLSNLAKEIDGGWDWLSTRVTTQVR
jgi:salicylate hydroxylase